MVWRLRAGGADPLPHAATRAKHSDPPSSHKAGASFPSRHVRTGAAPERGPIVSFEVKGAHPHDVATIIDRWGIAVRAGTHCVMPLLARYGVTATCRASLAMYNTREELDALAHALIKAQDFFA